MAGKAWLITHPETRFDHEGRVHGHLDPSLSYTGKYKAKQIAKSMKNKGVKRIHSSPRARALETATEISKQTGAPVQVHADLAPWDIGSMSGAKAASIKPVLDFFSSRPNKPIPSGEAKSAVLTRYKRFASSIKPGDVIVGHSQHSLAWDWTHKGGDAAKVPMIGGQSGEVRSISV